MATKLEKYHSTICSAVFKRGTHLADAFDIFKSDFNILCTVDFPQPDISARSRTVSSVVADG